MLSTYQAPFKTFYTNSFTPNKKVSAVIIPILQVRKSKQERLTCPNVTLYSNKWGKKRDSNSGDTDVNYSTMPLHHQTKTCLTFAVNLQTFLYLNSSSLSSPILPPLKAIPSPLLWIPFCVPSPRTMNQLFLPSMLLPTFPVS